MEAKQNKITVPAFLPQEIDMDKTLTKREQFAMMAMTGMLANSYVNDGKAALSEATADSISELAVYQADSLIAELEKVQGVI